ncbi:MAG: 30S ribosomal protein S16 [Deltaproteobacteria bacterium]|nr:30S ribosomal protein S16 [Deltaproteobacteria bacterium]
MAVHIRLSRHGTKKSPFYRVVVTDHRAARDGRFIENLGTWNPLSSPEALVVDRARLAYWQERGAQPSHTLGRLLKKHPAAAPAATAG